MGVTGSEVPDLHIGPSLLDDGHDLVGMDVVELPKTLRREQAEVKELGDGRSKQGGRSQKQNNHLY
jgi:hypothetical protein